MEHNNRLTIHCDAAGCGAEVDMLPDQTRDQVLTQLGYANWGWVEDTGSTLVWYYCPTHDK